MKGTPKQPHKPIKIVKQHQDGKSPVRRAPRTSGGGQSSRPNPGAVAAVWITIGVIAVVALIWAIHAVRQQVYRDRRIAIDMRETKEQAGNTCTQVEDIVAAISAMAEPALAQAAEVSRIMVEITGAPPPEPSSTSRASTRTSGSSPTRRTGSPASKARPDPDDDREAPPGLMSRAARLAQIEAERKRRETREKTSTVDAMTRGEQAGTPASPSGAGDGGAAYTRRTASREEPRIQALARKTRNLSEAVERKGLAAREMESSALRFRSLALSQKLYRKVKQRAKDLDDLLVSVQDLKNRADEEMKQIEAYASEARTLQDAHKKELARIAADKEAARKAKEHAALVKREIARAAEIRRFNRELVEKNAFEEALRSATDAKNRCRTDEGRAKIKILEDKYRRLVELKEFLIERLTTAPMSFGWIQDGPPKDVLGGDAGGIKTRGKITPWSQVSLPQMVKFIDFYLADKRVVVSKRGQQNFAVAIYFHELDKPEVADTYLEEAETLYPTIRDETTRLLGQ